MNSHGFPHARFSAGIVRADTLVLKTKFPSRPIFRLSGESDFPAKPSFSVDVVSGKTLYGTYVFKEFNLSIDTSLSNGPPVTRVGVIFHNSLGSNVTLAGVDAGGFERTERKLSYRLNISL
ncbi:hypothetical protein EVAR_93586_1 [Eumeta japonica]|uniref:Uncharacterized protein n=1 Tax=Eumeta variegata TaxID=151549 RepID=A0A4C1SDJ9_EUMVA|nr:hypothetical protein EVAR_93586_1 [Eumeta japonica]